MIFFSPALSWTKNPNPQVTILEILTVRLSLKLKVRVYFVTQIEGDSILIATSWQVLYVVITKNDVTKINSKNLTQNYSLENLHPAKSRQLKMINLATLPDMEAARTLDFTWNMTPVKYLDPQVLLQSQIGFMLLSWGAFENHPKVSSFKRLTLLTNKIILGAKTLPTLETLGLELTPPPLFTFYLPIEVNRRIYIRLSTTINKVLKSNGLTKHIPAASFRLYLEGIESSRALLNQKYKRQEKLLNSFGLLETQ